MHHLTQLPEAFVPEEARTLRRSPGDALDGTAPAPPLLVDLDLDRLTRAILPEIGF
ncbi:MAG: hypothetical protein IPI06_15940 [Gammaproteobacteria bacterium]|nr:hypothetical protein [Gammaproteobacteria bacterium]